MSKRHRNRRGASSNNQAAVELPNREPFYKKPWVVAVGSVVAVAFTFLLNAPTFFQNLRAIPGEMKATTSELISWAKEDAAWTGHWSSFPEGVVDMAELQLSDVDLQITIWAKEGQIDGTIATKEICKSIPFWNFVLLRGEVSGDTAMVTAWDIIESYKKDFTTLRLVRQGDVMVVEPIAGATSWFPKTARIGRHPSPPDEEPAPDSEFCKEELREFMNELSQPQGPAN